VDSSNEEIAVREARRMGVPVVSIVDTNSDPDVVDWVIPGNDDALRAIRLFTQKISDAVIAGRTSFDQSHAVEQKVAADQAATAADDTKAFVEAGQYTQYENLPAKRWPPPRTFRRIGSSRLPARKLAGCTREKSRRGAFCMCTEPRSRAVHIPKLQWRAVRTRKQL
jgi:hypothetical protein